MWAEAFTVVSTEGTGEAAGKASDRLPCTVSSSPGAEGLGVPSCPVLALGWPVAWAMSAQEEVAGGVGSGLACIWKAGSGQVVCCLQELRNPGGGRPPATARSRMSGPRIREAHDLTEVPGVRAPLVADAGPSRQRPPATRVCSWHLASRRVSRAGPGGVW